MKREEAQQLLMIIQSAYPNYKVPDKTITVNLWNKLFEDAEYKMVEAAVMAYVATDESGFAPSPGQIRGKLFELSQTEQLTEAEAWAMVSRAIRNSGYNAAEEFEKLPSEVQRAVGSASQLHAWAVDTGYNEAVISSNFARSYRAVTERKKELQKIPEAIRLVIENTERKMIACGE